MTEISVWVAFSAGFLSFLSPCVLPMLPVYVTLMTGISFNDITQGVDRKKIRKTTAVHAALFILGFSLVFMLLGASATYLGGMLNRYQDVFRKAGGIVVILLGIHFTGIIQLKFLNKEGRIHLQNKPLGYLGTVIAGITFAFGWTPCIGPILSSILLYAATEESIAKGMWLLFLYSMGLGIPFFISAVALNSFLGTYKKITPYLNTIVKIAGVLLIIIGIMIFTNNFNMFSQYLNMAFSE